MPRIRRHKKTLDFEIDFFKSLLKERPLFIEALIALGDAYTQKGDYEEGLAIDQLLGRLRPSSPYVFYNLACSYSLLNRLDEAIEALQRAVELGYDDFQHMSEDPDLNNVFKDGRFLHWVKEIKKA